MLILSQTTALAVRSSSAIWSDSKSASGRRLSNHLGTHQFQSPISSIVAGTRTSRTSVASRAMATARPRPISLTCGTPVVAKMAKTTTMMIAALVITLAERSEEHTSELQSRRDLVCRLLLEKKKDNRIVDMQLAVGDYVGA